MVEKLTYILEAASKEMHLKFNCFLDAALCRRVCDLDGKVLMAKGRTG